MKKVYPDAASALAGVVRDGQTIAVGGFGLWATEAPRRSRPA